MNKLFTRYLNSAAVFIPPDNNAAEQRDKIQVVTSHSGEDENKNENKGDNEKDENENNNDNNDNEEEDEEGDEEVDDENKDKDDKEDDEETPEQKALKEKEERRQARVQKRIDRLTASNGEKDAEIARLKAQLEANPKEGLTEEEVERRATEKAKQLKAQEDFEREQREFKKRCDTLQNGAEKLDKEAENKIVEMVEELGPVPVTMINILSELDNKNGAAVFNYLLDNVDEAEDIYPLSERRMAQKLIRISDKLKADEEKVKKKTDNKDKGRNRRDPPEPIRTINDNGRNANSNQLRDDMSMDDFIRMRNAQAEAYRKSKLR